jgi:glycosyltransferase involved in cell wall biosynthesis
MKKKISYIISDIDKALAFEWLASGINKEQFDLSFILLNPGTSHLEEFLIQQNIPVRTLRCRGKKDWPRVWIKLWSILSMHSFDVVHCHLFTASILGLSAAKMAGIQKRIYTRHHSDFHFRYFPKGVKWDKWCNKLATKIIAPSKVVEDVLIVLENVEKDKIVVVHHGFDLDYFKNVPENTKLSLSCKYNSEGQHPVIGVVSRFTELKGIQYIIPAFKKLLIQYPNALLLLFNAQGDYKNNIDALLHDLPDRNYKTIVFEQELAAIYTLFDVFIQASTDFSIEAFGQTYIEALASAVPSVFTLSGIAQDFVIHEKNALAVPFKDSESIYAAMMQLYENPSLAQQLSAEALKVVTEKYPLHKMIQSLERLYAR